jgi:hypothetical protein
MLLSLALASDPVVLSKESLNCLAREIHLAGLPYGALEQLLEFSQLAFKTEPDGSSAGVSKGCSDNSELRTPRSNQTNFSYPVSPNEKADRASDGSVGTPPPEFNLPAGISSLLTPSNIFGKGWGSLPDWFLSELNKNLIYLNGCGLSVEFVYNYLKDHWKEISNNLLLIDTGLDVGSCHSQAFLNWMLLRKYSQASQVLFPEAFYLVACRILFDLECRYTQDSVGYLHSLAHAKAMPEDFPLKKYVDKNSGQIRNIDANLFSGYLRRLASMSVVSLLDRLEPTVQPRLTSSVQPRLIPSVGNLPRVPYPISFERLLASMEQERIPYCVELVSVSASSGGPMLQLHSEHAFGIYDNTMGTTGSVEAADNDSMLILQWYAVNLPRESMGDVLGQLRCFSRLDQVLTTTVLQAHGNSDKEPITNDVKDRLRRKIDAYGAQSVSGWLKEALIAPSIVQPFSHKFGERWVRELISTQSGGLLGIRHVYLTAPSQFGEEQSQRPKLVNAYQQRVADHVRQLAERAERRTRAATEDPSLDAAKQRIEALKQQEKALRKSIEEEATQAQIDIQKRGGIKKKPKVLKGDN